jgi:hypothetical protein
MQHRLRHVAIVREQQQPLAHYIKPTYMEQLSVIRMQIFIHGRATLWIRARTDRPGQLIQRNPHVGRLLYPLIIDFNDASGGIHLNTQLPNHDTVDLNSTLTNEILTTPARRKSRAGEKFIQTNL